MKHQYKDAIKPFLHDEIVAAADDLALTQAQAAEKLRIETRSYSYLKSGETMCSATTLLFFLTNLCQNPMQFINHAKDILTQAEENESC